MSLPDNDKPKPRMTRALIGFALIALFMYLSIMYKIVNYGF